MKKLAIFIALSTVFIAGCSDTSDRQEPATAEKTTQVAKQAATPVVTIDLTLKGLQDRYNQFVEDFNKSGAGVTLKPMTEITDMRISNEAQALYQGCSTKGLCLSGLYDTASGKIILITVRANGGGKEDQSGLVALSHLIVGTSAATLSAPKFNSLSSQIATLIDGKGFFTKTLTVDGYHYEFRRDEVFGNELTVKKLP